MNLTCNLKGLRTIVSCCFAVVVVATGGHVFAMEMNDPEKQEMLQHYERATRAYDIQKYSEAVEEYQKAYEIGGDPAMLYNVAQAYRLNDQLSEALHSYRRYLQRSPNARNRVDVERKIAELEQTIEARRKAAEAEAAAHPPPPPVPAQAVFPPPTVITLPDADHRNHKTRVAGVVLLSVGAAALIAAGVTGALAAKRGDSVTRASMNGEPFDPNVEKSGKSLNTIAIVSAIGGGTAALIGTVLLIVSSGGSKEAPTATALVMPVVDGAGSFGLGASLRF